MIWWFTLAAALLAGAGSAYLTVRLVRADMEAHYGALQSALAAHAEALQAVGHDVEAAADRVLAALDERILGLAGSLAERLDGTDALLQALQTRFEALQEACEDLTAFLGAEEERREQAQAAEKARTWYG